MHIAIGYHWFPATTGWHIERALLQLGHTVTYVGLGSQGRAGYDNSISVKDVIDAFSPEPDVYLWIDSGSRYFPSGIEDLDIPSVCYLIDVHLSSWRQHAAQFFDAVFIAQKDYVDRYRQAVNHTQVFWLPLAAAQDIHLNEDLVRIYDVGFVGNITSAHRNTSRRRRLKLVANCFHTNDFYRYYQPDEIGRVYSQSRIVFNTSIAGDVTMRVFEGTACGALMLTDSIANGLGELFQVGSEIVTFDHDADLLNKAEYYLKHEDERSRIASAGYHRTLNEHTYAHRAQNIIDAITATGFQRLAPMRRGDRSTRLAARRDIYTHLQMLDALLDETRTAGYNPLQRIWIVMPALARRLLRG